MGRQNDAGLIVGCEDSATELLKSKDCVFPDAVCASKVPVYLYSENVLFP